MVEPLRGARRRGTRYSVAVSRWSALRARLPPAVLAAAPDLQNGLRAAVTTVGPFALASALHDRALVWAGLGGWLATLADPGGTRRARARVLAAFAIAGALALLLGELASITPWTAPAALGAACFATSLLRALGASGATAGTLIAIVFAIGTARGADAPLRDAGYFALGALSAVLLSSIVWPVGLHAPMRHAVARAYRALAGYSERLRACALEGAPEGDPRWSRIAREERRACREAIEQARVLGLAIRARTAGSTAIGSSLRELLGAAESELALVVTLGETLEAAADRALLEDTLGRAAANDRAIAHAIAAQVAPPPVDATPGTGVASRLAALQRDAREIAATLEHPRDDGPWLERSDPADARAAIGALRDALSPRSIIVRHATRVAAAAIVAGIVGQLAAPEHAHWVVITAIAVLQPYPGATWRRALERVLGTVLGSVLALAITLGVDDPRVMAVIMFPLSAAAVATRGRSYRLFTFFLTPVFVLIAERYPGDWHAALERAGDAALGGLVAAIAAVVVFPSWERERMPDALAVTFRALAAYARAVGVPSRGPRAARDEARRSVALALAAAETSLERLLSEPRRSAEGAARALDAITYARRLAGALTAIASSAPDDGRFAASIAELGDHLARALDGLEDAARARRAPPDLVDAAPWEEGLDPALRTHFEHALAYLARLRDASAAAHRAP